LNSEIRNKQQVPVEDLIVGLYVVELDRPWLETPFLLQGFPIADGQDIEALKRHCQFVWVDPDRSESKALRRLHRPSSGKPRSNRARADGPDVARLPPRSRREIHRDLEHAFGREPYPSPEPFRRLVRIAGGVRQRSREVVDEVFRDARLGSSLRTENAREVVRDMVSVLSENASASLWLTNLKKRDEYTSIHCINVCVLAVAFGRHLGLEREELEMLGLGALLHDVGKVRTPEEVLNKPGRLTPDEFDVMKAHPQDGYEMMRDTGHIPVAALEIIRFHHERVSGAGYPMGLRGRQISLPVLIAAVADVYDAMTSDRVYRKGMTADETLRIMFERAAVDYGQELVEEFIRCLGIYPVGSVVELETGALGVVVSSDRDARLRPVVLMVRTPDGEPYGKRLLVNLAAVAERDEGPACTVRRVVRAEEHDVDVARLIASEFGA